jgi:hypothetical protein
MEEPKRIGLTEEADGYLDEILDSLRAEPGGEKLIKFDLYRLAVALGLKKGEKVQPITGNTNKAFRVAELDPEKALYFSVSASQLQEQGEPVYPVVERLAERGIREFYLLFKENMGKLPWDKILV